MLSVDAVCVFAFSLLRDLFDHPPCCSRHFCATSQVRFQIGHFFPPLFIPPFRIWILKFSCFPVNLVFFFYKSRRDSYERGVQTPLPDTPFQVDRVKLPIICGLEFREANMNLRVVKLWWNITTLKCTKVTLHPPPSAIRWFYWYGVLNVHTHTQHPIFTHFQWQFNVTFSESLWDLCCVFIIRSRVVVGWGTWYRPGFIFNLKKPLPDSWNLAHNASFVQVKIRACRCSHTRGPTCFRIAFRLEGLSAHVS